MRTFDAEDTLGNLLELLINKNMRPGDEMILTARVEAYADEGPNSRFFRYNGEMGIKADEEGRHVVRVGDSEFIYLPNGPASIRSGVVYVPIELAAPTKKPKLERIINEEDDEAVVHIKMALKHLESNRTGVPRGRVEYSSLKEIKY